MTTFLCIRHHVDDILMHSKPFRWHFYGDMFMHPASFWRHFDASDTILICNLVKSWCISDADLPSFSHIRHQFKDILGILISRLLVSSKHIKVNEYSRNIKTSTVSSWRLDNLSMMHTSDYSSLCGEKKSYQIVGEILSSLKKWRNLTKPASTT